MPHCRYTLIVVIYVRYIYAYPILPTSALASSPWAFLNWTCFLYFQWYNQPPVALDSRSPNFLTNSSVLILSFGPLIGKPRAVTVDNHSLKATSTRESFRHVSNFVKLLEIRPLKTTRTVIFLVAERGENCSFRYSSQFREFSLIRVRRITVGCVK